MTEETKVDGNAAEDRKTTAELLQEMGQGPEQFTAAFERFAELGIEKRGLDARLRAIKDEMASMQDALQEGLTDSGLKEVRLESSGALVHFQTDATVAAGTAEGESATEEDWNAACDALEAIGLGEFSKRRFLLPTLKSYVKQLMADADANDIDYETPQELLPPELAATIRAGSVTQLRVKGGNG